jgi:bifunctional DNA-binding transcriptional regulator/antitoxin component of YhaV-PrlF toxin-antitoxin module
MTENKYPEYKIVRVTSKRQFTIPKRYFDVLHIGEQVKCYLEGKKLVIEPVHENEFWDFSTDILRELVAENYTGEDLLREFESRKYKAARALERMVEEARDDAAAGGGRPAEDVFKELLGSDDV